MVEQGRFIEKLGVPICPFWKEYVVQVCGDEYRILALCGRVRGEEPQAQDTDTGLRLSICPWYKRGGRFQAYRSPAIVEIRGNLQVRDFSQGKYNVLFVSGNIGRAGIEDLRYVWPSMVKSFLEEEGWEDT